MASIVRINHSKMGAADLCDGCLVVLLDDSIDEFYEGEMGNSSDKPTLRHVNEEQYRKPDYFHCASSGDEDEDEDEEEYKKEDEDEGEDKDEEEGKDEDNSEGDFSPGTPDFFIAGVSPRWWKDELPGLPAMAETADAGCQLCQFLRQAILRKEVPFEGPVHVRAGYVWGASRTWFENRDDGLVAWRCEVFDGMGEGYLLSAIDFNVETRNGKCSGTVYA